MITLRRQISEEEKEIIIKRFGRRCYATGHDIPDESEIHFDHIRAFSDKGTSSIDNIAPMCKTHNLKKGALPLEDFRIKIKIEEFFERGKRLTLKDELQYFLSKKEIKSFGDPCYTTVENDSVELEVSDRKSTYKLFTCPTTKWKYFYVLVPVAAIDSDDDAEGKVGLQPRYLIFDKVFNLYRHFQRHPVLQPSIARLTGNKLLVFDGQHKIAAMLWAGRKSFDLKVYLDPDPRILNNTNIAAHDKFAQTRFYSSIMVSKLGSQFGKQFEDYKNSEDETKKSEYGFVESLKISDELTRGEANKRFKSFLYDMVLDPKENKVFDLLSDGNRSSNVHPLTVDMLGKSILANFLYTEALDEDLASDHYKRDSEINNVIRLFNIIYKEALCDWDGSRGSEDANQNKLSRMFRSKSIISWSEILRDAVIARLKIIDADDQQRLFYRNLTDDEFDEIQIIVRRLVEWSEWSSPQESGIDRILSDNKKEVKRYMKGHGLTPSYLLGAPE